MKKKNLMGIDNLSLIFSTNILKPQIETEENSLSYNKINLITNVIIEYYEELVPQPENELFAESESEEEDVNESQKQPESNQQPKKEKEEEDQIAKKEENLIQIK